MTNSVLHSEYLQSATILGAQDFDSIRNFLRKDIPSNLFMISWLENYGVFTPGRRDLFEWVGVFDRHHLNSVALLINKRLLMLTGSQTEEFASHFEQYECRLDHIVAKSSDVTPFWNAYSHCCPKPPRLKREQKYLILHPENHKTSSTFECELRVAQESDLDAIFFASAAMHVEESLENPLDSDPIMFRRHVQRRIQTERTYVWTDKVGRLVFKADVSAQSSFGSQISGIYVPPSMRRKGFGQRAVNQLCTDLFSHGSPLLTLYVNADNPSARSLYEKVGFQQHCEFQSIFVV